MKRKRVVLPSVAVYAMKRKDLLAFVDAVSRLSEIANDLAVQLAGFKAHRQRKTAATSSAEPVVT